MADRAKTGKIRAAAGPGTAGDALMKETRMIRIFVGFDPRETIAFHVLSQSIHARASAPVSITPLMLSQLGGLMTRGRDPLQSTDFSFSRFLVPYLCGYEGWALFMDCDMLMLEDVAKLWDLRDDRYAVQVVKHDHEPEEDTKFLGAPQTRYEKKNWSSVMLFNCARCAALTPDYVNAASGLDLHRFHWLDGDHAIGDIPRAWNHLVAYDPSVPADEVCNLHYTIGGPYFEDYANTDYAADWFAEKDAMLRCDQRRETD